ncbi:CopD family protein [Rickettsiales bacterium LUAb2]
MVKLIPTKLAIEVSNKWSNWQIKSIYLLVISSVAIAIFQISLMGFDYNDFKHLDIWLALFSTSIVKALFFEIVLSLFALFFLSWLLKKQIRVFLISLIILIPLTELGHSAIHSGWVGLLQRINQVVHLFFAAYWSIGLILICYFLPYLKTIKFNKDVIYLLNKFSFYGHFAVFFVIISGIISTIFIVGIPYAINVYTVLLSIKIILVSFMVLIALCNRYLLIPRLKYSDKYKENYQKYIFILTIVAYLLSMIVLLLVSIFATMSPT